MVEQGDIIYIDFDPQLGTEQAGYRPALVVSTKGFQNFTLKRAMLCPITSTNRGYPAHIPLDSRTITRGVIMCDQLKTLDLSVRHFKYVEKAPEDIVSSAIDLIAEFLGL